MKTIEIIPSELRGTIDMPPSKSMSHRMLIAAGLAEGESRICNVLLSEDVRATIRAIQVLGATVKLERESKEDRVTVRVRGAGSTFKREKVLIDCGESGSTLRFLIPVALQLKEEITFTGKEGLARRPLTEYYHLFEKKRIFYKNKEGGFPLTVSGRLRAGIYRLRGDVSSQFISGLMMALPLNSADAGIFLTSDLESASYVRMTMQVLEDFGIRIKETVPGAYRIRSRQSYRPKDCFVEGDYSQAAFWLAASAISKSESGALECLGLSRESVQGDRKIVDILRRMGARIEETDAKGLKVYPSDLHGMDIDASDIPDLVPILALALSVSRGRSRIYNAKRLRLKESDRILATVSGLSALGAKIEAIGDEICIEGQRRLQGGSADSFADHRIAMMLAIASTVCKEKVTITGADAVAKSYPHFFEDFQSLGGVCSGRE